MKEMQPLRLIPDRPELVAYIHPPCLTVEVVDPAFAGIEGSMTQAVLSGDCDCETPAGWLRIYVEEERK